VITFDPITPAPLSVRIVRPLAAFALVFAYLGFRVYPAAGGRIPLGEVVVMSLILIGVVLMGFVALGDLIAPLTPRAKRPPSELEITAVHAPIADADTVVRAACEAEIARLDALTAPRDGSGVLHGTLLQPAVEQMTRELGYSPHDIAKIVTMVAEGSRAPAVELEDTQPFVPLFTHDYEAMHHTPPGGIRLARPDLLPPESFIPGTGRHHRAGE
jgi:hypothetical protein